jgi:hypothetical protein
MTNPDSLFEIHIQVNASQAGIDKLAGTVKELIGSVEKVIATLERIAPLIKMAAAVMGKKVGDQ